MSKAILVIDISDEKLEKYNEEIEDLSISYTVNGKVENYVDVKCSYLLKPAPEEMNWFDDDHYEQGYNQCLYEILGEK